MKRRVRRSSRLIAEINVVPYIDVMLVLLVIFMITVPMLEQGLPMQLPTVPPTSNAAPALPEAWVVKIVSAQEWRLLRPNAEEVILGSLEELEKALRVSTETAPLIRLKAGADLPYQQVMDVMSLLQRLGLNKIQLQAHVVRES